MGIILSKAKEIEKDIINDRRYLHKNAEVGFELIRTVAYVEDVLKSIGCSVNKCGKSGLYTVLGHKSGDECVMLRADMDALPIKEESGLEFSSDINMHACGHDMHTAMLLGAARVLKAFENELKCPVKLVFQPAEEILSGALDMIESGILKQPQVTKAYMLHCIVNSPIPTGTLVINSAGISAPFSEYFEIIVNGKGCHGAMPNSGIDPIVTASHIISALDTIKTRELSIYENTVLTVGSINAGNSYNVIPQTAIIKGTYRGFNDEARELFRQSVKRISKGICNAFNCSVEINFPFGCPTLFNDEKLPSISLNILREELGEKSIVSAEELSKASNTSQKSIGSEDFAYFSHKVPSLLIGISAGSVSEGYNIPLHHPKVKLNEEALVFGVAALATLGLKT